MLRNLAILYCSVTQRISSQTVSAVSSAAAGKSLAAIPQSSAPRRIALAASTPFMIPPEAISIIMGLYTLVGMMLACVNVTGDAVITLITAKAEHKLDLDVFRSKDA